MKFAKRLSASLITCALAFLTPGFAAGFPPSFDSSLRHYEEGELDEAFKGFKQLAENGDAASQYYLALIYSDQGKAVPQNLQEAAKWHEKSAAQGYVPAQSRLGEMYLRGNARQVLVAKSSQPGRSPCAKSPRRVVSFGHA